MTEAYMNWSGGKDSALCLYHALRSEQYAVHCLLTSMNAVHNRISMHGVRRELLEAQAASIGIPLQTVELPEQPGMQEYEAEMMQKVRALKRSGCTHAIFGDIFLEDLRRYREDRLREAGIICAFPLWQMNTVQLLKEFIESGFKGIIVCVNEKYLGPGYCGRMIDEDFLQDLPPGVDPCGENGEFHSFVFDGPIFGRPVHFSKGETVYRTYPAPGQAGDSPYGFYFCDLLPSS